MEISVLQALIGVAGGGGQSVGAPGVPRTGAPTWSAGAATATPLLSGAPRCDVYRVVATVVGVVTVQPFASFVTTGAPGAVVVVEQVVVPLEKVQPDGVDGPPARAGIAGAPRASAAPAAMVVRVLVMLGSVSCPGPRGPVLRQTVDCGVTPPGQRRRRWSARVGR